MNLLMCYVDHHDQVYEWAERRKLVTHSKTGAAQLLEIRETVKEVVPVYIRVESAAAPKAAVEKMPIFANACLEKPA